MVELKWLIAIAIVIFCFIAIIPVEAKYDPQYQIRPVGRDGEYSIRTAEGSWLLTIRYITNIEYFIPKGAEIKTIWRPGVNTTRIDSVHKLYPKSKYTVDEVTVLADEAVKAWIDNGKKLIVEVAYPRGFPGRERIPPKPEVPIPEPELEPETEFTLGADFYNILAEQNTILYIAMLFIMVLALLVMKLANPMIIILGICGVTAIFWVMFNSVPLIIPAAMIVFFFVISIVGGKSWQG